MVKHNVAHLSDNRSTARRWRGEPTRWVRWGVREPTGREDWRLYPVESLDDEACARAGLNVIGPALCVSGLGEAERTALARYSTTKQGAEEAREILGRLPRATTHAYDVDVRDDLKGSSGGEAAVRQLAGLVKRAEAPHALRESYSAGEPGRGRHLERGPAEEGAERAGLTKTMLRLAQLRLAKVGLVPVNRARTVWTLPEWEGDEGGARAVVDLARLNHDPWTREGIVRPLGGVYKDGGLRKCLLPGSPTSGDPLTREELDSAPPPPPEPRGRQGRRKVAKAHEQLADLPRARRLPHLGGWVRSIWRPYYGHELRMALSDLLQQSGLVRASWGIDALGATGNLQDAQDAWRSTEERRRAGRPNKGLGHLAESVGRVALWELAWALWQDLHARGSSVELAEVLRRLGFVTRLRRDHAANAMAAGQVLLSERPPEGLEPKELASWRKRREDLARRLKRVSRCGRRGWRHEECPYCERKGCLHTYHCDVVEACALCAYRAATGALDALALPEKTTMISATFATKKLAETQARRCRERDGDGEDQVQALVAKVPGEELWRAMVFAPTGSEALSTVHRLVLDGQARPLAKAERLDGASPQLARGWIARLLLARHVEGRELLEGGKVESFASHVEAHYRRRVVRQGNAPAIPWPKADVIKETRLERAALRAADQDEPEEPTCECPDELVPRWRRRYEVVDTASLEVLAEGLRSPPSFDRAIELEDRLHGASEVARSRSSA